MHAYETFLSERNMSTSLQFRPWENTFYFRRVSMWPRSHCGISKSLPGGLQTTNSWQPAHLVPPLVSAQMPVCGCRRRRQRRRWQFALRCVGGGGGGALGCIRRSTATICPSDAGVFRAISSAFDPGHCAERTKQKTPPADLMVI